MKTLLEKILEVLNKKNFDFTNLISLKEGYDGKISMQYGASKPTRTIDVEFESKNEAINYLNSLIK